MWPPDLVVATHNPGKLTEWRTLLGTDVDGGAAVGLPEVEETASTFLGNARLKAEAGCRHTGRPALGEDAGLEVLALDGAPGVHTRRFMDARGGWRHGVDTLRAQLPAEAPITYVCALVLVFPDGRSWSAEARVAGNLVPASGEGPGISPWFRPVGHERTWAELGATWRRHHDHRALAVEALQSDGKGRVGPT